MTEPWSIIQNAVFGHTGCDGDMADRTASAIESALEQAGFEITPIEPPLHGYAEGIADAERAAWQVISAWPEEKVSAELTEAVSKAVLALTPKEPQP